MNFSDILEYKILETEKVTITVYNIMVVVIVFAATWLITWSIKRLFNRRARKTTVDTGKVQTIYQLINYFLWIIAIMLAIQALGIKITLLLAGSAALLVGLGLGLQQIFQDIVSGVFLLFEGTIKVEDIVELQGIIGRVKEIGIRSSKIETRDNIIMIIPNSRFIRENVVNWSHLEKKTRFEVNVGVAYGSDVELVKNILMECAEENTDITNTPTPFVRFNNFGDSALEFQLFFWTTKAFFVENTKSDLRFAINKKFKEYNVRIPFPQHDVHIKKDL